MTKQQRGQEMADMAKSNGSGGGAHPEPTIEQVRDLLFGGAQRSLESRLSELHDEMQATISRMQAAHDKEMEALRARLDQFEKETEKQRLASQRQIGAAISELGASIVAMGTERSGQ